MGFAVNVKLVLLSLLYYFNHGSNVFTRLPRHGSGQSKIINVISITAWESNPDIQRGESVTYLSAMATTCLDVF